MQAEAGRADARRDGAAQRDTGRPEATAVPVQHPAETRRPIEERILLPARKVR
jgi:hypothetical protein